jgi:integrase
MTLIDRAVLQRKVKDDVALLILLCWFTSGRPGDVMRLRGSCINLQAQPADKEQIAVEFRQHKTSRSRSAYVVHTSIPARYLSFLTKRVKQAGAGFLFCLPTLASKRQLLTDLREWLRSVDPTFNSRSLRRGTLQAIGSDAKNPMEVLMAFSGHTTAATTDHYLSYGAMNKNRAMTSAKAAMGLRRSRRSQ